MTVEEHFRNCWLIGGMMEFDEFISGCKQIPCGDRHTLLADQHYDGCTDYWIFIRDNITQKVHYVGAGYGEAILVAFCCVYNDYIYFGFINDFDKPYITRMNLETFDMEKFESIRRCEWIYSDLSDKPLWVFESEKIKERFRGVFMGITGVPAKAIVDVKERFM